MAKPYRAGSATSGKREVYEVDEIRQLLKACPDTPTGARDQFVVMLLWCTGLKPAELVSLRPRDYKYDVDLKGHCCDVVRAGNRRIVVPGRQRDRLRELLERWLEHRGEVAQGRSPLLCNLRGGALDTSYLRHMFAGLSEDVELEKRLHTQGFRNTFAAAMQYKRVPMEIIRRQLGLSDLEYTSNYLDLVAPAALHEAMENFSLE